MQRKSLAIWLCDDMDENQLKMEERELDLGEGKKPPGFYVRRPGGLFPAPLPPHSEEVRRASEVFRTLGIFMAKVAYFLCCEMIKNSGVARWSPSRPPPCSAFLEDGCKPTVERFSASQLGPSA